MKSSDAGKGEVKPSLLQAIRKGSPKMLDIMAILLTQGLYALVDGADYEQLSLFKWHVLRSNNTCYAVHTLKDGRAILLHCQIMNPPKCMQVDHINHNGLDNRRHNLRLCTISQNHQNGNSHKDSISKYKGVSWHSDAHKWYATIYANKQANYLGLFNKEIDAAVAYDNKAKEIFGDFALLNFS